MKRLMIFTLALLSLTACLRYDIDEVLLERTDVSLTLKGKLQYAYSADYGQMAINADRTLFRYMTDDLATWMEVKCQTKPGGVGEKILADVRWKSTLSKGEEKDLEFEIRQTDGSGTTWLWNNANNIGLIIRDFE
jgi:hypothetical protein